MSTETTAAVPTEPKFPDMRKILEARLDALEADRGRELERMDREIGKVEKQLAAELEIGLLELRKQRKGSRESAGADASLATVTQAWAREDDEPAKAVARIKLIVDRADVEHYVAALSDDVRKHADVVGAVARKLEALPRVEGKA